jgi:uncharacterized protein YjdB
MPYIHKLAKRLACNHRAALVAALTAGACVGENPSAVNLPDSDNPITIATAATPTVLLSEGFDDADVAARGWYDNGAVSLSSVEYAEGSGSLESRLTAGGTSPSWRRARHQFTPTEAVYLSYRVKYSANWQGSVSTNQPLEFALLTTDDGEWAAPGFTHLTVRADHYVRSDGIVPSLGWQDAANIDVNRVGQNLTGVTEQRAVAGCNGDPTIPGIAVTCYGSGGAYYNGARLLADSAALARDRWQLVEVFVQLNTVQGGVGQADGVLQYWVNGRILVDRSDVIWRTGARSTMLFNQIMLAPYLGGGSPVTQTAWYDDLRVATGRIAPIPPPPPVASVSVAPASGTFQVGETVQLTATPLDSARNVLEGRTVSWTSSAPAIASVDDSGLVTAAAPGSATISAASEGQTGTAMISVVAASVVLFSEGFEDANVAARGWYDNGAMTVTTAERAEGSRSLEARLAAGSTIPSWSRGRHLFAPTESVYLSYRVKYSSNWQGSGQTYHPHEFKLVTTEDDVWVGPAFTHLTVDVEHNVQNGGLLPRLSWQDGANIDQTRIGQNLIGVTELRAIAGCNGDPTGPDLQVTCYNIGGTYRNGVLLTAGVPRLVRNAWQFVEVYVRLNSIQGGVGRPDGVLQYWVDGELVLDRQDLVLRTGAHAAMQFRQLILAPYIGDGSPVTQTAWYDDLRVATGRLAGPPPPPPPAAVASVTVAPTSVTRTEGETAQLTATLRDAAGNTLTGRVITWSTNAAGVATVNGSGLVTAVAPGAATITATSEGRSGTAAMTVVPRVVPVASVTVTPTTATRTEGETAQLTATLRDAAGNTLTGRAITWSTSAAGVATVNGSGLVTAVAPGAASITATSEGRSGTAAITVVPRAVPVASVTVTPATASASVGQTVQLTATPRDAAGNPLTGRAISWATSAPAVASVGNSGLVSVQGVGTAVITATSEGRSGSATVTGQSTLPTPNIVNNASFESGFDGFVNGSFSTPTGVSRDAARGYHGSTSVRKALPVTNGNTIGGFFTFPFYAGSPEGQYTPTPAVPAQTLDRLWTRYYFYFDRAIDGTFKFNIYFGSGFATHFGGVYCQNGYLGWAFIQEWNSRIHPLVPLSSLVNGWHSLEVDYWRNGDPSGFPSVGIWLDGVQLTHGNGTPPSPGRWSNGRLIAGERRSSEQFTAFSMLGVLNGTPSNTIAGNVWVDRVSASSAGRIGQ